MSGPYRSPERPEHDDVVPAARVDLGPLRSRHGRTASGFGRTPTVGVHQNGLAFGDFEVPFDEIDAIHYDCDRFIPGPPRVVLVTFDGVRQAIPSDLEDLDQVIEALDRAVTRPLTTRAKEALTRGEMLTFGPLVLELDGIVLRGKSLSWSDLSHVVAERDSLVFRAREPVGRFGWARLIDLPHPRALLEVLRVRTDVVLQGLRLRAAEEK